MKTVLFIFAALTLVSCQGKKSSAKKDINKMIDDMNKRNEKIIQDARDQGKNIGKKKPEQGLKCLIVSESETKDIFIKTTKKDNVLTVSIHDYSESGAVEILTADVGEYKSLYFNAEEEAVKEKGVFVGKGILIHPRMDELNPEGKTIMLNGILTLDFGDETSGSLQQQSMVSTEAGEIITMEAKEIAQIESCEEI